MGTGEELGRHSAGGGAGGGHFYCAWGFQSASVSVSVLVFGAAAVGVRCWRQRQCRCQSASGTTGYYLAALADNAVVAGCVQQADGLGYFYVPSFFFSLFFFQLNRSINRVQYSFRHSLTGQDCLLRLRLSRRCEPVRE